MHHSSAEG